MTELIARFAKNEDGATAIEYGLIAAVVGIGIISSLSTLRDGLNAVESNVNANLIN